MNEQEILSKLNPEQRQAVLAADGPVLILAGAGSGKTRVLVHRIAYLMDVLGVSPGSILAITFTNKAADEMRSRVDNMIGFGADQIQVSTFHSFCVRILRRYADRLGYTRYFSIYDTDDQLSLMKQVFHAANLDSRMIREKAVLSAVSSAKDELVGPSKYRELNKDYYGSKVGQLYESYQKRLESNNAMDFDDLIMKTVELLENHPDVLEVLQDRFRYLMIDEYQDTNTAQFRLVSLIAAKYRNLCVVGDDDQSIYRFRGANIRNILGFETIFPDAAVIRLEQNYRSTKNILEAANEVIRHNHGRKEKKLWTENEEGCKPGLRRFENGFQEADFVAGSIREDVDERRFSYSDCAVLYRTNAQSRLFEEKFIYANIPYRIVGGINFYARREIKDLIAYLKTVDNGKDDIAARRIINIPKRGIGSTTLERIAGHADLNNISFYESACESEKIPGISKSVSGKIKAFVSFIQDLKETASAQSVSEVLKKVLDETGYAEELDAEGTEEAQARIENIEELINKAVQYEENAEQPSLSGFLEEVALIADIDETDMEDDRVLLMTLHSAKGLEFPCVYIAGMEEGLFPSRMSIEAEDADSEIEEERRLAYVGMTRAKKKLMLLSARERMYRGDVIQSPLSRFVREIPRECLDTGYEPPQKRTMAPPSGSGSDLRRAILKPADTYRNPYAKPAKSTAGAVKVLPDYREGDSVRHVKFGQGIVKEITDGGRDYYVAVDFPGWGVKKLCASAAHLEKV